MKSGIEVDDKFRTKIWSRLFIVVLFSLPLWAAVDSSTISLKPIANVANSTLEKCYSGIYKGPQEDKTYFTKDPWLWVVTPEFANRFCMPSQFVSTELKGAEAIAFRILDKSDTGNCQMKENKISCYGGKDFRFEIYQKSDTKLPKLHTNNYYQKRNIPSAGLLNASSQEWSFLSEKANRNKELALSPHFEMTQVGLYATAEEWIVGPSVVLEEITFVASAFSGLDFYAFEGSSGFFSKPEILQSKNKRFSILYKPLSKDVAKPLSNQPIISMEYRIEMPQTFTDQLALIDREFGFKLPK